MIESVGHEAHGEEPLAVARRHCVAGLPDPRGIRVAHRGPRGRAAGLRPRDEVDDAAGRRRAVEERDRPRRHVEHAHALRVREHGADAIGEVELVRAGLEAHLEVRARGQRDRRQGRDDRSALVRDRPAAEPDRARALVVQLDQGVEPPFLGRGAVDVPDFIDVDPAGRAAIGVRSARGEREDADNNRGQRQDDRPRPAGGAGRGGMESHGNASTHWGGNERNGLGIVQAVGDRGNGNG